MEEENKPVIEVSLEAPKAICKKCNSLVIRKLDKEYDREGVASKLKRWVDEKGFAWNGKMCPTCHRERVKSETRKRLGYVKKYDVEKY